MKSNIVLTSAMALLVSAGANALEYKPFVGATLGMQGAEYSAHAKEFERAAQFDYPTDFFVFGVETGVRAGSYFDIYNGGLTLNATKTTYSKAKYKFVDERMASADMFNVSMTYDNYLRISGDKQNRIDVVLGAGFGSMAYHMDSEPVGQDEKTKWSFDIELKAGLEFELAEHVILTANFRTLIPTRPHYEMDITYIVGGGVKYIF
jgi:opacity protein-like surface antigen